MAKIRIPTATRITHYVDPRIELKPGAFVIGAANGHWRDAVFRVPHSLPIAQIADQREELIRRQAPKCLAFILRRKKSVDLVGCGPWRLACVVVEVHPHVFFHLPANIGDLADTNDIGRRRANALASHNCFIVAKGHSGYAFCRFVPGASVVFAAVAVRCLQG